MDQKNKTVVIAAVAILAVALVATNFEKITGKATGPQPTLSLDLESVSGGQEFTVTVRNPGRYKLKEPLQMRKVGGVERKACSNFERPCSGSSCDNTRIMTRCKTSPSWSGGYYVEATEYKGEVLGNKAYFVVT